MDILALVARVLFAALFVFSGTRHLLEPEPRAGYAAVRRIPSPRRAVQVSGAYILVAGILLALGVWPDLAALALVPFLLISAFLFHGFWQESDPQVRTQEELQFFKDVSLAGGALGLFALYAGDHPGLNLVGPLFTLG